MANLTAARRAWPKIRDARSEARQRIMSASDKRGAAAKALRSCTGSLSGMRVNTILRAAGVSDVDAMMRKAGISSGHSEVDCGVLTALQRKRLLDALEK